jgi:transposase-like protein
MNEITKVAEGPRRHSAQEWADWVRLFTRSGQKTREFCRERGLALSTFSYWRRRLREAAARTKAVDSLVEVRTDRCDRVATAGVAAVRITVSANLCVEVREGTDVAWLAAMICTLSRSEY